MTAAPIMRYPHPPFVIRVVAWAPMKMAMTVAIVADGPVTVYPGFHLNIVAVSVVPAPSMAIVSSRSMVDSGVMVVEMAIIIENRVDDYAPYEAPN